MNKTVKTIIRITLLVLVSLIIGVNVYSINASRLGGNAVPMPFGVGATVVLSGSMEPHLSTGDLLLLVERESYSVRDVVVFQDGRTAVVHRIISMDEQEIITKGDANNAPDEPITREQIKGEVVLAIPLIGYAVNLIKTPVGTIVILLLAVWLLNRSFHKEKEKDNDKMDEIRREIERLKQQTSSSDDEPQQ